MRETSTSETPLTFRLSTTSPRSSPAMRAIFSARSWKRASVCAGLFDLLLVTPRLQLTHLDATDRAPGAPRTALLSQVDLDGLPNRGELERHLRSSHSDRAPSRLS